MNIDEITKKADVLTEALPYVRRFRGSVFVIKYGGAFMDDPNPEIRARVARDALSARSGEDRVTHTNLCRLFIHSLDKCRRALLLRCDGATLGNQKCHSKPRFF